MKNNKKETFIKEVKKLRTVADTTEWWCRLMKEGCCSVDKALAKTINTVSEMYWELLCESSERSNAKPPYLGELQEKDAKKFRKVIAKYGYDNPDDFNRKLFCFQAEMVGHARNFGLFIS